MNLEVKGFKFRVWTNVFMGKWEYRPVCQIRWNVNGHLTVNACDDPQWWIPVIFPNDCGHVLEQRDGRKWKVISGKRKEG